MASCDSQSRVNVPEAKYFDKEIQNANWDRLGIQLGLGVDEIKEIERDHQSAWRRKMEMFNMWKKKDENASWEKLIAALEDLDEKSLAGRLREKYLTQLGDGAANPATTSTQPAPTGTENCSETGQQVLEGELKLESLTFTDEELQRIKDEATRPQTASIVTFGKIGSGKSSLALCIVGKDKDAFKSKEGFIADETRFDSVDVQVGQVTVNVIDTHGMMDPMMGPGTHNEDAIELVGAIATNESKGVIVVCIKMYERVDESTLMMLATLHKKFGESVWNHVIIALTNADRYEENKWLSQRFRKSKKEFLVEKFAETVKERQKNIKEYFTADTKVKKSCKIGMATESFNKLKIPIIPTAQLDEYEMKRMKQVGCEYWFDVLLIKCCQRLQGCGLIQIHEERLSKLPTKIVRNEISEEVFEMLQRSKSKSAVILGIIKYYMWYKFMYHKKTAATLPRFDWKQESGVDESKDQAGVGSKDQAGVPESKDQAGVESKDQAGVESKYQAGVESKDQAGAKSIDQTGASMHAEAVRSSLELSST